MYTIRALINHNHAVGVLGVYPDTSAVFCSQKSPEHLHELCESAQTGHFIKTYSRMKLGLDEFWDQEIGAIASALATIKPITIGNIHDSTQPTLYANVNIKEHSKCSWVPAIHQATLVAQASYSYTLRLDDFPSRKRNSGA